VAAVLVDITVSKSGERGQKGKKMSERKVVRTFEVLLALAVEEAGLASSNAEVVKLEGEKVK